MRRPKSKPRGIADLERGARKFPYVDTVHRLADALGLEAAERAALLAAGHRPESTSVTRKSLPAELPRPVASDNAIREVQWSGGGRGPHNLPAHPIRLIGRDEELAAVRPRLLEAERGRV